MSDKNRRLRPIVMLMALAVLTSGFHLASWPGEAAEAAPAPDHLKMWVSTNGGGRSAQDYSRPEALDIARRYDLVLSLQRTFEDHLGAMRAENPDITMIVYDNILMTLRQGKSDYPDSWYARDKNGNKIVATAERIKGTWQLEPSVKAVRENAVATCRSKLGASGYDGCYLDSLGAGHLGNLASRPVNPRTKRPYTDSEWVEQTSQVAGYVSDRVDGLVLVNGISKGGAFFDDDLDASRFFDRADGGNAEGWVRGAEQEIGKFRPEDKWRDDVDLLVQAEKRGKTVIAMTKIWRPASGSWVERWRRYTYATFLLGTNGNQYLYFNPKGPGKPPGHHPYDDIDLGRPTGAYFKADGMYQRWFTDGVALVNPTEAQATISLGGTYRNLSGQNVTSVTLGPNTADILTHVSGGGGGGGGTGGGTGSVTCNGLRATIVGTEGADNIVGTNGRDVIHGLGGSDRIDGLGGDDLICGGTGRDVIKGGSGNDTLEGNRGDDILRGEDGSDRLRGGDDDDLLRGNRGTDDLSGERGSDRCYGGASSDKLSSSCEKRR